MRALNRFDAIAAFERELSAFRLVLPRGGVIADGSIHRLDDGQHRRKRNGAGWFVLRETPDGRLLARYGNWRTGETCKWDSRGNAEYTAADRKAIADQTRKIEAERAEHYRQGAERATAVWAAGKPCSSHPYLTRKGVTSHGLRVDHAGRLLIPVRDLEGELRGVQRIDAKGEKRFTFGTDRKRPTCFVIGNIDQAETVAVVEGYATGATVHEATGWPVVVAFDAGGLERIAKPLRQRLLKATLVFAGDHDLEAKGGTGQNKARGAARVAGGVFALPPTEGHDWNDHAAEHGLDDVANRLLKAAGIAVLPPTVTLAEGTARLDDMIGGFFAEARAWHDLPEEQRPLPTARLVNVTMGAGKSHMARRHAGELLADQSAAATFTLPLHRLTSEQAKAFKAETGLDAAIWRGMEQPDPNRDDGKAMCLEPELSKAAQEVGLSATVGCKVCPSRNECGYRRQQGQKARAWFLPHDLLYQARPKAIPAPAALVIDEKFHDRGMREGVRLAASTLEGDVSDVPHAGDRELLREYRGMLLAALKAAGATVRAPRKLARLTKAQLEAVGLTADMAQQARGIEWTRKPKPKLSGDVADMVRQLRALSNRFTSKVPTLWGLVEALLRGDHDQATNIEVVPDAALQGGDGRGLLVLMHHRLDVHESWRCPTLLLDGTARPEIVRHWFPDLVAHDEIHIEAPHQRVTWIRSSFSKNRLVPDDLASERRNQARRNNVEELRRYIEVQAARYRRRNAAGPDLLVVTYKGADELLQAGRLPANVVVAHFNNLRGTNAYQDVRAVMVVGRPLITEAENQEKAERMAGRPLDQDDPMGQAVRWSICEAELLQVIARGRGIRRTEANPLDVLLLGDVPLPLKIDTVTTWEQVQPTPLELMAARGLVPDCQPEAKGYWPLMAAVLPDVFKDVQAAKNAARGSRCDSSMSNISIDVLHRENGWRPLKARPHDSRYSIPVLVDPDRRLELAATLDLAELAANSEGTAEAGQSRAPEPVKTGMVAPSGILLSDLVTGAEQAEPLPVLPEPSPALAVGFEKVETNRPDPLADYDGGIMPELVRDQVRGRWRAAELTQNDLAQRVGISRPQLANALQGRFGLSPDAAARLRSVVATLPSVQASFWSP